MRINADGSVIMPFAVSASANTIRTSIPVNITADKAIRHMVLGMLANLHTVFVCYAFLRLIPHFVLQLRLL